MGFEEIVESRIQEAMAEGLFDNLRGTGKPLPPSYFAEAAGDNWIAFKVLQNGGMLPEWLLLGREIEQDEARLRRIDAEHAALVDAAAASGAWESYAPAIRIQRDRYADLATSLRAKQHRFNWDAPGPRSQRPAIWVEYHLERLDRRLADARANSPGPGFAFAPPGGRLGDAARLPGGAVPGRDAR